MPQQVRRGQNEALVRQQPLTAEQAREIAKKSHQRMKAQAQAAIMQQPVMPERIPQSGSQEKKGIQIQLVKRHQPVPHTAAHHRPQPQVMPEDEETDHVTRVGAPDRRFVENKALPPPPKRRDSVGVHLTKAGTPDRRYLENQHLSAHEAEIEKAKEVLRNAGIRTVD